MATIIPVFGGPIREDLLGFVTRIGATTVEDVVTRFGWSYSKSRTMLNELIVQGKVERQQRTCDYGRYYAYAIKGFFEENPEPDPPLPPAGAAALRRA